MTQGVSRFIAHHTPSTMGLCRWTRSHCSIASLILEFPRSMYSLVNLALSFVVQEFQISFSFRSIEPSDTNPSTRLRKSRTEAPLFTKSSIKVRQKVSIPPNCPKARGQALRFLCRTCQANRQKCLPSVQSGIVSYCLKTTENNRVYSAF